MVLYTCKLLYISEEGTYFLKNDKKIKKIWKFQLRFLTQFDHVNVIS
jgi:hypothetical protein